MGYNDYKYKKLPPEDTFLCVNTQLYVGDKKRRKTLQATKQKSKNSFMWTQETISWKSYQRRNRSAQEHESITGFIDQN